jgi:hypothetical protein
MGAVSLAPTGRHSRKPRTICLRGPEADADAPEIEPLPSKYEMAMRGNPRIQRLGRMQVGKGKKNLG